MLACDYLARVGFVELLDTPTTPEWADEDDLDAVESARLAAERADHARVRAALLAVTPSPRAGDLNGARWVHLLTWPDRVPGFKTWAGQSTLAKIIAAHQRRLKADEAADLFAVRGAYRTAKGEGPSGIDPLTCQDAIDVGFSPSQLGMDVQCRPAVELLAVVGLEAVPLVSFGPRLCGFVHDGQLWRFEVEGRSGGYAYRWGEVSAVSRLPEPWEAVAR